MKLFKKILKRKSRGLENSLMPLLFHLYFTFGMFFLVFVWIVKREREREEVERYNLAIHSNMVRIEVELLSKYHCSTNVLLLIFLFALRDVFFQLKNDSKIK